jgi:pimeloyl-ACP methyl ester carboxylesterase
MAEVRPSIVLVHGAFADASWWVGVITRLIRHRYVCYAPANPLRGIAADADYLRAFLTSLTGPVVLVGHSYGGAVITSAAAGSPRVTALVYIAAYAPTEGETLADAARLGGGSPDISRFLILRPYPGASEGDADAYVDPAQFHRLLCAELDEEMAAVLAASQRGLAVSALSTPSPEAAWVRIPSWYLVASRDQIIRRSAQRAMAARAAARTVEIDSCHAAMISHPAETADLIRAAAGQAQVAEKQRS